MTDSRSEKTRLGNSFFRSSSQTCSWGLSYTKHGCGLLQVIAHYQPCQWDLCLAALARYAGGCVQTTVLPPYAPAASPPFDAPSGLRLGTAPFGPVWKRPLRSELKHQVTYQVCELKRLML